MTDVNPLPKPANSNSRICKNENSLTELLEGLPDTDITFKGLKVPGFGYSLNPHNGSSGSKRNNSDLEHKPISVPRKEALAGEKAAVTSTHRLIDVSIGRIVTGSRFTIFVMSSALSLQSILDAHKLTGPNLAVCFHCNKLGHWKRNCKVYFTELKKKGSETTASDSGMFMIEVNMSLGQISTWVLDTACGSHICNLLQGLKGSRTLEKDEVILHMGNGAGVAAISVGSFSSYAYGQDYYFE
ncbi:hypothetical protein AgCh_021468 [Apium graveolens]